jgi:hypothetical protein
LVFQDCGAHRSGTCGAVVFTVRGTG